MSKSKKVAPLPGHLILSSLNPVVKVGGKTKSVEEPYLRTLLVKAVKEGKFHAIKKLLEIFDEAGALGEPPKTGGIIFVPKYFEIDSYFKWFLNPDRKGTRPKLSKIGERKQAEFVKDKAELRHAWEFWTDRIKHCDKRLRKVPHPFYKKEMSLEEYRAKLKTVDHAASEIIERRRYLMGYRRYLIDHLQEEFDLFNKKWSRNYTIPGLKRAAYKRPPKHRQFKKGTSGNPAGRPRVLKDRNSIALRLAMETLEVTQDGKTAKKPVAQVVFDCLLRAAMSGNSRAEKLRDYYLEKYDPNKPGGGFLVLPADDLTDDEFQEELAAHRKKSAEDLQRFMEEDARSALEYMAPAQLEAPNVDAKPTKTAQRRGRKA